MPTIRQEINILCTSYTGTGTVSSNEIVQLDTSQYSGTVTYYFEAVYSGAASNTGNVRLTRSGTTTDDATVAGSTSATVILTRSTSFSPPAGQTEYIVRLVGDGTRSQTLKSARIIVIQTSPGPIFSTETQIEIGSNSSITATVIPTGTTNATNPKFWLFTAANWDSGITAYFEATFSNPASSKSSATVELQHDDGSFGATWVNDVAITTSTTSAARVRSAAVTLTPGRHYRIVGASSSSKTAMVIYNAKIIIDSPQSTAQQSTTSASPYGIAGDGNAGVGGQSDRLAVQFSPATVGTLNRIDLNLLKSGSPTDNIVIELLTNLGAGGTVLASFTKACTSLTTSPAVYSFIPTSPVLLDAATYYISIRRSGAPDTTNIPSWRGALSGSVSWSSVNSGTSWSQNVPALYFITYISSTALCEPQYLLANTLFAAGTALQTFLTKWDSTEWVTTTGLPKFKHDVDAGAATTSTIELDTAAGVQLTGSVVTNPASEGTSGLVTMPANGNLDVKATTNGGNLTASRILAIVNLGPVPPPQTILNQAVKRAALW